MSLRVLPADLLVLITGTLSFAEVTRLVKLSGDAVLSNKCCRAGGVTRVHIRERNAIVALSRPQSSIVSTFAHLTHLRIQSADFSKYPLAFMGAALNFPKTLICIIAELSDVLNLFLRPIDEASDPDSVKSLRLCGDHVTLSIPRPDRTGFDDAR